MVDLYRHFDADGALLYVGMSLNAIVRLQSHNATSHWSNQIASMSIERFEDRRKTALAEAIAIRDENPLYNVVRPCPDKMMGNPPKSIVLEPKKQEWPYPYKPNEVDDLFYSRQGKSFTVDGKQQKHYLICEDTDAIYDDDKFFSFPNTQWGAFRVSQMMRDGDTLTFGTVDKNVKAILS